MTKRVKATEQYFPVVVLIMLCKVVPTINSVAGAVYQAPVVQRADNFIH